MNLMKLPILYKLNSRNKKQYWTIEINSNSYTIKYGQEGGKEQETTTEIKCGKNIGKSNETTIAEQTSSEALSLWKKQIDKGYRETISNNLFIRPMLAHSYADYKHKIIFPCYAQPKLDGVRALYINGELLSRKGKIFTSVPHIIDAIKELKNVPDGMVLDGELYNHNESFQDLVSYIRREEPSTETQTVEFHIYDCFVPNKVESYEKRLYNLANIVRNTEYIKQVYTKVIIKSTDIDDYHNEAVADGYEGIMLRNSNAPYMVDKRSYDLLKVKSFQTEEFEIVGAEQNKGRASNQCTIICKTKNGIEFGVKPKGNEAAREQYWIDKKKNMGKMLTVRFFEWTDSDPPVPRFPIGLGIRDYEGE